MADARVSAFQQIFMQLLVYAADTRLGIVNTVQKRFLRNLNISVVDALHVLNLAPLSCRRTISNLGIIYRAITNRGPAHFHKFFRLDILSRISSPRWRTHGFQVCDETSSLQRDYITRSTFGYV